MQGWSLYVIFSYGQDVTSVLINNFSTQANAQAALLAMKTTPEVGSDATIVSAYVIQVS